MLTVTATYKGLGYEATELGEHVVIHAPTSTCWTHWHHGRLVRSPALAATAPQRVVSRLEARLRRAGQLGARWEADQMARNARAEERLLWARDRAIGNQTLDRVRDHLGLPRRPGTSLVPPSVVQVLHGRPTPHAITPAENERGWAALQLPETASHEEILGAIGHPPDLDHWADASASTVLAEVNEVVAQIREGMRVTPLGSFEEFYDIPPSYVQPPPITQGSPPMDLEVLAPEFGPLIRVPLAEWARLMGLPETASREEIIERFRQPPGSVSDHWVRARTFGWFAQPEPITQGSPAYMQALVAQITPETARLWADAWGCAPHELAQRVLEPGPGDLVDSDTARELSRRILADVGQPAVDGARRADRSALARHNDPDIPEDLEYYDDTPEPLEDVEWLRGVLAETEQRGE